MAQADEEPRPVDLQEERPEPTAHRAPPRRRNLLLLLFGIAVVVYATDVVTKIIAVETLTAREPIQVIGTFFQFDLVRNPGAAFGLGVGMTIVFSLLSIAVILVILRYANRLGSRWWAVVFGLVLGGAFGNLTDRVARSPGFLRGHVIDFLYLTNWPVFNIADTAFCTAGAIVVLLVLRNVPIEGRTRG